jgi:hypothetical protein
MTGTGAGPRIESLMTSPDRCFSGVETSGILGSNVKSGKATAQDPWDTSHRTLMVGLNWLLVCEARAMVGVRLGIVGCGLVIGAVVSACSTLPSQACTMSTLAVVLRSPSYPSGQASSTIVLTNSTNAPCTLAGFPEAQLAGPPLSSGWSTYDLPRQSAATHTVRLAAGAAAESTLTFLVASFSGDDCDAWKPDSLVIRVPGDPAERTIEWTGGPFTTCLRGATHQGSYIGPFTQSTS